MAFQVKFWRVRQNWDSLFNLQVQELLVPASCWQYDRIQELFSHLSNNNYFGTTLYKLKDLKLRNSTKSAWEQYWKQRPTKKCKTKCYWVHGQSKSAKNSRLDSTCYTMQQFNFSVWTSNIPWCIPCQVWDMYESLYMCDMRYYDNHVTALDSWVH